MEDTNKVATGKSQVASAAPAQTAKPAEQKTAEQPAAAEKTATAEKTDKPTEAPASVGFVPDMNDVLSTSKSRSSGGAKIRPGVGYTLVADGVKKLAGTNVPEQEQVILKILNSALSTEKPVISEVELNKLVVAAHAAGKLKTKQDAWHIFRYYRTDLIKRGALKQVDYVAAS